MREPFTELDPVRLLQEIRAAQPSKSEPTATAKELMERPAGRRICGSMRVADCRWLLRVRRARRGEGFRPVLYSNIPSSNVFNTSAQSSLPVSSATDVAKWLADFPSQATASGP